MHGHEISSVFSACVFPSFACWSRPPSPAAWWSRDRSRPAASTRTTSSPSSPRCSRTSRTTTSRTSPETELMYGAARGLTDVLDPALALHGSRRVREAQAGDRGQRGDHRHRHRPREAQARLRGGLAHRGLAGLARGHRTRRRHRAHRRRRGRARSTGTTPSRASRARPAARSCSSIDRRGRALTFHIKREKFEVKAVEWRLLADGYGYIKLRVFSSITDAKVLGGARRPQAPDATRRAASRASSSTCAATRAACSTRA